jgi:hypothetical protein
MIKGISLAKRKLLLIAGFIAITLTFFACSDSLNEDSLNSVPEPSLKPYNNGNFATSVSTAKFKLKDVKYWVKDKDCRSKSKCDSAMMVVQWNDAPKDIPDALVWGYIFPKGGKKTGADMIEAITKADPRFYLLSAISSTTDTVTGEPITSLTVGGIGFSVTGKTLELSYDEIPVPLEKPDTYGFFTPKAPYDYDNWQCPGSGCGPLVHWEAGWYNGYWAYDTTDTRKTSNFTYSEVGASLRELKNGSYDAWIFTDIAIWGWDTPDLLPKLTPVRPPEEGDDEDDDED